MILANKHALQIHTRFVFGLIVLFVFFLSSAALLAQEFELERVTNSIELDSIGLKGKDTILLPIPISNPTIGTGLGVASALLYQIDEKSPSSYTGIGGFYADSGSWGLGIGQNTYLLEDALRINALAGYGEVNYDFFGVGNRAGDKGFAIPIEQAGYFLIPEIFYRVWDRLYLGIRFRYIELKTTIRVPGFGGADRPLIPELQLDVVTSGIGILAEYDTRDNVLNPYGGTYFEFNSNFSRKSLGSDFNYEQFFASYNNYIPIGDKMVIATRASLCHTSDRVPFFDLCLFGTNSDLRGYIGGQYRDRNLLAAQVEYRWQFNKRFGMVAFAGIGSVAPKIDEFKIDDILPSRL